MKMPTISKLFLFCSLLSLYVFVSEILWPDLSVFPRTEGGQVLRPDFMSGPGAWIVCFSPFHHLSFISLESGLLITTKSRSEGSSNHQGGFLTDYMVLQRPDMVNTASIATLNS
jgi:hypothetical protein